MTAKSATRVTPAFGTLEGANHPTSKVCQVFLFSFSVLVLPFRPMLVAGYTLEIVNDARDYADHAGRANIAMDDVRLAVRKKQDALAAGPPTREVQKYNAAIQETHTVASAVDSARLDVTAWNSIL